MSETDDTDTLLIIPPNFFGVRNSDSDDSYLETSRTVLQKPVSCTAQVLGKLVNQVHSLESRLEDLEIDTSIHSIPNSRSQTWNHNSCRSPNDRKYFTFPRRHSRKVRKEKNIDEPITNECASTVSKLSYRYKTTNSLEYLINESLSMDGDISSIVSTPSKKNDKLLLNEIDEFLTKVDTYECPEYKLNNEDISSDSVIKTTSDYLTQKHNPSSDIQLPSGRIIPLNILDKYIYLAKNNQGNASNISVSDLNYDINKEKSHSIRKLNFTENKDVQPTSTPKQNPITSYRDNFRPSSNKIYDRATKVLEQYKCQNSSRNDQNTLTESEIKKEEFKMPQMRPFVDSQDTLKVAAMQVDSIDTELLSLSDLWGDRGDKERVDSIKLEEERLKREHCEALIQQLQKKILDQQEKLAVAMKVDKAKDVAISKLKEAWLRLTTSLGKAEERHKGALDKMMREVENFKSIAEDSQRKTNHFEKELYKTLDLAHDYQEKCKQFANEKIKLQEDMEKSLAIKDNIIEIKNNEMDALKDNYEIIMRLNKQSADYVKNLENAIEKEKSEHDETKLKALEMQHKMNVSNEEKEFAEQERDILKEKVNEERSRCSLLERQLSDSQSQFTEQLKKYDALENEAKTLRKHLELQKSELKCHYQQQLEDAVLSKLQEFQKQLDVAQKDMDDVARGREAGLIDNYNKQISRIEEQHKLEVNVLEEKQKEEIKLYRLQLAQASEKIGLLENKLDSFKKRRGEMAAQLHAVMQAQWTQALRILTRPQVPSHTTQHNTQQYSQHNTQQYSQHNTQQYPLHNTQQYSQHNTPGGAYPYPQQKHAASHDRFAHLDDSAPDTAMTPLSQEYGLVLPETTRDDVAAGLERLGESEMQRYIRELLTKKPNLDTFESSMDAKDLSEEPTSDRPGKPERRERVRRSLSNKPPWKA